MFTAYTNLIEYKNRHIEELQNKNEELQENNKALAFKILEWGDRAKLNKAVRVYAGMANKAFSVAWKE